MTLRHLQVLAVFFFFSSSAQAADLTGRVVFSGTAPAPQTLNMKADPLCAKLHSKAVADEEQTVNKNGTLKNVFVYVKQGLEGQTFEAPKQPAVLTQEGCLYTPRVFGLRVGQPLEMMNKDATLHNVRASAKEQKDFNVGMPLQGMKVKKQFSKPEVMVPFKCDVHPWMRAYAGVLPHPFFAVTGEDGSFTLAGLPAGSYVVEAWHEKLGTQILSVTLKEGEAPAPLEFQFASAA